MSSLYMPNHTEMDRHGIYLQFRPTYDCGKLPWQYWRELLPISGEVMVAKALDSGDELTEVRQINEDYLVKHLN